MPGPACAAVWSETRGSLQLRPAEPEQSQQLHPDTSQGCEGGKERQARGPGGAGERQEAARGVSVDIVTHALTRPRPPVSYFLIRKLLASSLLSLVSSLR